MAPRPAQILALLLLAPAILPAAPAQGAATNQQGSLDETGWVAHKLHDPEPPIQMRIELESFGFNQDLPLHIGFAFNIDDEPAAIASATWHEEGEPTRITVDPILEDPIDITLDPPRNYLSMTFTATANIDWTGTDPGTLTAFAWTAGDGTHTHWALDAEGGTLTATTTGDDTFLVTNAATGTGLEHNGNPTNAHALLVHETIHIEQTLIGHLTPNEDAASHITGQSPTHTQTCPCQYHGTDAPAGTYTFAGTHAASGPQASLVLSGADATLP